MTITKKLRLAQGTFPLTTERLLSFSLQLMLSK